jgi:ribokinase
VRPYLLIDAFDSSRKRRTRLPAQKPIVVVGSINTDLVATTRRMPALGETVFASDFAIHPGGKGANQAVAIARLGYPVRLLGKVGADVFGEDLLSQLRHAGVDTSGVSVTPGVSGVAVVIVSGAGDNSILVSPGANNKVTPEYLDANIAVFKNAGLVLAQLEIPLETVEYLGQICAREGLPLILDPAPAAQLPDGLLNNVAWFTPNQTEALFYMTGKNDGQSELQPADAAEAFLSRGCGGVVLKMGATGTYLRSRESAGGLIPAFPVEAVDTTAAGDAFNGGFATGLMLGKTPWESATFAAAVAAISVTRSGAQPSMPGMHEVDAFMREGTRSVHKPR